MPITRAIPLACLLLASCAGETPKPNEPTVTLSQKEIVDVYEAAIRYRLMKFPLQHHRECDVFIQTGKIPSLAPRFPEYRMIVKTGWVGSVGRPTPPVRWYDLTLGHTARDHVFVNEMDARNDGVFLELRRKEGHWIVVGEEPFVII